MEIDTAKLYELRGNVNGRLEGSAHFVSLRENQMFTQRRQDANYPFLRRWRKTSLLFKMRCDLTRSFLSDEWRKLFDRCLRNSFDRAELP